MRTWILGTAIVVALAGVGCGDDDDTADDNDGGGDSGNGGNGSSGTSADRGDGGPNSGGSGTGVAVGDGTQFTGCRSNTDCDPGLNCYTFGGYCSAQCTSNEDCSSLGANAGCYQAAGGGMMGGFFGGMMGGSGGATGSGGASSSTATGTCRISCTGVDDTSCPTGLMCIDVGANSFRCALPGVDTGNTGSGGAGGVFGGAGGAGFFGGSGGRGGMQVPGDTESFDECMGGGCVEGLTCSSSFGRGFCTQTCQNTSDCTDEPGSGDATPTCGRSGRCVLECTIDADECPDGMTCTRQGGGPGSNNGEDGGAPVTGRCNYSN